MSQLQCVGDRTDTFDVHADQTLMSHRDDREPVEVGGIVEDAARWIEFPLTQR